MYLVSLHGQGTSSSPGSSGMPTECMQGTKSPARPSASSTCEPILVMIRMLATTYGESVISTPVQAIGDPSGPMLNGTTYNVRPRMQPSKRPVRTACISRGSIQLFVGPASLFARLQTKVLSSTRATSLGSDRAR
jgi:hypothetical protein